MRTSPMLSLQEAPLTGRRILIVEDEYFLADDMVRAFRTLGAEIAGPVGQLEDAVRILHQPGVLDGAVLDVNLRSEMVFPVARELRARGVPFMFTTGYDKVVLGKEFKDVPLWEKPIDVNAMVRRMVGLIGNRPA